MSGEIGLHATPMVAGNVVVVGAAHRSGGVPTGKTNVKGYIRGFDVQDRQAPVDLPHDSAARRVRQRHVAERFVVLHRQHWRLGTDQHRSRARHRVSAGRKRDRRLLRRRSARQQSVRRKPRRRRSADRQAQVALPARASRHLGSRHPVRADACGHQKRREDHQGGCAAEQAGVHVRLRPRDRSAALADRGTAGAERRRAGRILRADAAVPARRARASRSSTTRRDSSKTI